MDFDQDEALLAITSVSVFAKLLTNEIASRLAFDAVQADLAKGGVREFRDNSDVFAERIVRAISEFVENYLSSESAPDVSTEFEFVGALEAYIKAAFPRVGTSAEKLLPLPGSGRAFCADLVLRSEDESVVVEIKRLQPLLAVLHQALEGLKLLVAASNGASGILLVSAKRPTTYETLRVVMANQSNPIYIIAPEKFARSAMALFGGATSDFGVWERLAK